MFGGVCVYFFIIIIFFVLPPCVLEGVVTTACDPGRPARPRALEMKFKARFWSPGRVAGRGCGWGGGGRGRLPSGWPAAGAIFRHSASGCCHLVPRTGLRPRGHRRSGGDGSQIASANPRRRAGVFRQRRGPPCRTATVRRYAPRGGPAPAGAAGSEAALPRARPQGPPGP